MRVIFRLYRTITIPTEHMKGILSLEADAQNDVADQKMKELYGPHFSPGFKVFWPEEPGYRKTVVGIEAMAFDVGSPGTAQAGFVSCDPIHNDAVQRLDGALEGELRRIGIYNTKAEDHQWRGYYEIKGK